MSERGLYEIVPGIELKPGDLIRARPTDEPDGIVGEQVADVYRLRPDLKVFRRVSDADDPRVLRRALELVLANLVEPEDVDAEMKRYIEDAEAKPATRT